MVCCRGQEPLSAKEVVVAVRPPIWTPPVEPSPAERTVMRLVKRAKLFVFLREHRHEIFDEGFQGELGGSSTAMASSVGPRSRRRGSRWPPSYKPTPESPTTRWWRRR